MLLPTEQEDSPSPAVLKIEQALDMPDIVELLPEGELALPGPPVGEMNGNLPHLPTVAFDEQFQADFVTDGVERCGLLENFPWDREKTRHRILDPGQRPGQEGGESAVQPAIQPPVLVAAGPGDITTADREGYARLAQGRQQPGDCLRRMAQIRVHANQNAAARFLKAPDDRRTQPAFVGSSNNADRILLGRQFLHDLRAPILTVVVDDDDFVSDSRILQGHRDSGYQGFNIFSFMICRNDNREADILGCAVFVGW